MWTRFFFVFGIIFGVSMMLCDLPVPPPGPEKASVELGFELPSGEQVKTTAHNDTTGNQVKICIFLNLTKYLDSVVLKITMGADYAKSYLLSSYAGQVTSATYPIIFSAAGSYNVTITGYVDGELRTASGTITIFDRPQINQNQKPVLTVPKLERAGTGQTLVFLVTATDPDTNQQITIIALKKPANATFIADTFKWSPVIADTGTDTVTFIAFDNGSPVKSDTESVVIFISTTQVNRAPQWIAKKVQASAGVGSLYSYDLRGKCKDPDNDSLKYSLISESPTKDSIIDSKYTFTPVASDTGKHLIHIVAQDPSGSNDTLELELTVSSNLVVDTKPPVIKRVSPIKDSTTISSSGMQITVSCSDESKIDSVQCFVKTTAFKVMRSGDSLYSAQISGLIAGWNTVMFVARDASSSKNACTLSVHLNYDNTVPDNVPPMITFLSPSRDTTISEDSFQVKVTCVDNNGISSVKGYRDATSFELKKSTADENIWTGMAKEIIAGNYSTIKIVAVDSSAQKNKDSVSVRIKYDNDKSGPMIMLVNPAKDSFVTSTSSYLLVLKVIDPSGVLSVNGKSGTTVYAGVQDTGSLWKINVTSLEVNKLTPIILTAIDSSLRANSTQDTVYIKSEVITSYTITFEKNDAIATGGMVKQTIKSGATVSLDSVTFLKTGWSFVGWATSPSGDAIYANGGKYTMGNSDMTLYAQWKQNKHVITFDKNDSTATGTMASQTIAEGTKANLSVNAFSKSGWNFAGWATSSTSNAVYANQDDYTMGTVDVTLYAKWTPKELILTFDKNDLDATGNMTPQTITSGALVPLKANTFQKNGWTFAGWAVSSSDTVKYLDQGSFRIGTGNVTLFAKWTPKMYTITFNANGIAGNFMNPQSIASGSSEKLKPLTFGDGGCHTFVGWATTANGTAEYGDQAEYKMGTSDVTLYAIWKLTPLVVTPSAEKTINICIKTPITVNATGCNLTYEWHYIAWGQDEVLTKGSTVASGAETPTITISQSVGFDVYCKVKDSAGNTVKSGTWTAGMSYCPNP
jgi:uncharacterized repeat protein (TIGR02543 family)